MTRSTSEADPMKREGLDKGSGIDQDALRKLWRQYCRACAEVSAAWRASGYRHPAPESPPFPDVLRGLQCGAKTRAGTPCKQTGIYENGRCKLHGGLSTGPTTPEGKAKAASNGNAPKRKRTP